MISVSSPGTNYKRLSYYLCFALVIIFISVNDSAAAKKPPNILLITVDTLRADRLHCYGYEKETSPVIDRLAGGGVLFENASTVSTRTTQSIAAMFTGRYPQTIGVRSLHGRLKPAEVTLAEVLKQHGYHTGGVSNNTILRGTKINQGFDFYKIVSRKRTAEKVNKRLLEWLKQNKAHPVFAWVHYLDPHMPYSPPPEYKDRFSSGYRGRFEKQFAFVRKPEDATQDRSILFKPEVVFNHVKFSQQDLKRIRALYDGEIAYTDMAIGKLLEEMKTMGLMDNTIVVINSDHGESLGEHKYFFDHGDFVYEATVRVPLIFYWPGKIPPGRKVRQNVRTIDILPTILSLMGINDPFAGREGVDLAPVILGKNDTHDLPVYSESGRCYFPKYNPRRHLKGNKGKIRALRAGDWKLILTPTKSGPVFELYNLADDPSETKNLAKNQAERVRRMAKELTAWMKKGEGQVIPAINKREKELLRSLGYIQ